MKEELISIIIPVYNVAEYLDECLKSVCGQTYQNIEVILIDDGSTDGSGRICDEWKERDSRIRVAHTKNRGVSAARNTGLEMAGGVTQVLSMRTTGLRRICMRKCTGRLGLMT